MSRATPLSANETIDLLTRERGTIVAAAFAETHSHHYDSAGEQEVRRRLDSLLAAVLESLQRLDLGPTLAYVRRIAAERFRSGYDLWEVQAAFNGLERAMWARIFAELEPEQYAEALGLVSTIVGAGKDELARAYVSQAADTRVPTLDLSALFAGTAGR